MPSTGFASISGLIDRWIDGDKECLNELLPLINGELRRIAHRHMQRERLGHTLQTTALVNEAYLKLARLANPLCRHRVQFLALAAESMRHILVDHARAQKRAKRGGGVWVVTLDTELAFSPAKPDEVLALDEALTALAKFDKRKVKVVELRYFGGLSVEEVAEALNIHPNSVIRDWKLARAWLKRELSGVASHGSGTLA